MPERRNPREAWSTGPVKVDGGIKARSRRGEIAQTWWSRRFIEVLESLGMGGRLQRGRNYARAGQVLSMSVSKSLVLAQVQGSRPTPYRVRIAVAAFTDPQWASIETALSRQALFTAKLLAGEMPAAIEEVFTDLGLTLFPGSSKEMSMDCSCPDWEVPCKHLAATCYLLAESFDEDPFEILAWRGRARADLLERLHTLRDLPRVTETSTPAALRAPALSELLDSFWIRGSTEPASAAAPTVSAAAVVDQLDPLPVLYRGNPVLDLLRPAYLALADAETEAAESA